MVASLAKAEPAVPAASMEQITMGAVATAAIVWGGKFVSGRLKQDAAEKLELAAAVKRSDAALAEMQASLAEVKVAVAKCETHREHDALERERDARELRRLSDALAAVQAQQQAQITITPKEPTP